jgi:hypothetical protein
MVHGDALDRNASESVSILFPGASTAAMQILGSGASPNGMPSNPESRLALLSNQSVPIAHRPAGLRVFHPSKQVHKHLIHTRTV